MYQEEQRPSEMVPFQQTQIIAAALILGPLFFAGVAYVSSQNQQQPGDPMLAYVGAGVAVMAIIASMIAPTIVSRQQMEKLRAATSDNPIMPFFQLFQTLVIVRAAILEGAAFFCCIAYMSTRLLWALGAALVLLVIMGIFFPTRSRFDDWVRMQRELIAN